MKGIGLLIAAGLAAAPIAAQPAAAQTSAILTADLNLRTGPDLYYPPVAVMPAGTPVTVYGCIDGWLWCDVGWGYNRGWVAGQYLAVNYVPMIVYGPRYRVPLVSFIFGNYWDTYYRGRPWYGERERWADWDYKGRRWREGHDEKKWQGRQGYYDPKKGSYDPKRGQYDPKRGQYDPKKTQFDPKRGQYDPKKAQFDPKRGQQFDPKKAQQFDPKKAQQGDPKKGADKPKDDKPKDDKKP